MKAFISISLLMTLSGSALAQSAPAQAQPPQPQPPVVAQAAAPVAPAEATAAPGVQANVNLQLSAEDRELIERGEISTGEHIGGGVASLFLGFGIGHAVQGRWGDRGWIFTVGETASIGLMIYGATRTVSCAVDAADGGSCSGSAGVGWIAGGVLAYTGLHIWETIDAFVAPASFNRRVRAAQARAGLRPMYSTMTPYLAPAQHGEGAIGGLSMRF